MSVANIRLSQWLLSALHTTSCCQCRCSHPLPRFLGARYLHSVLRQDVHPRTLLPFRFPVRYGCRGFHDDDPAEKLPDLRFYPPGKIRNFSIVAHVDHGKSTLADRLLEMAGNIQAGTHDHQVLDRLEVERERGITVKAQTASLFYEMDGEKYLLNLIDTPGHVDFSYEVQRSLTACQGVVLLVDANQGIQAQTLATFYSAFEADKAIIPVLNKIDLKNADPDGVTAQMVKAFDMDPTKVLRISAKVGTGVKDLIRAIIQHVPPPPADASKSFKGLLFDSSYDKFQGVIALIAVMDGQLRKGDLINFVSSPKTYEVRSIGVLRPERIPTGQLLAGQVGYIVCNMKSTKEAQIGDTVYGKDRPVDAIKTLRKAKPMVFAGIYPEDQSENESLQSSLDRLLLNDSSVSVAKEHSAALGQGWRLGFLGLLHMDVFLQRLEYEHGASCIATIPSVPYKATLKWEKHIKEAGTDEITIVNPEETDGECAGKASVFEVPWRLVALGHNRIVISRSSSNNGHISRSNRVQMPDTTRVQQYREPWVIGTIISPLDYMSEILSICMERRGQQKNTTFLDNTRVMMQFYLPLSEIIVDFFDVLKSCSSGYASFDYEDADYRPVNLVKIDFLLNGNPVSELSILSPVERARSLARQICLRLKETVPQQQFAVAVQALIGGKIIAREDMKALRKDVVGLKIYSHGGRDKGRKMKLLSRQKEGKERMRKIGNIEIPRDCFVKVLRKDD